MRIAPIYIDRAYEPLIVYNLCVPTTKKTDRQIHLYTRSPPCLLKPIKNLENQAAYLMKYVASLSHLWQFFISEAFTIIHSYLLLFVLNSRKCSMHKWAIISMIISYPLIDINVVNN